MDDAFGFEYGDGVGKNGDEMAKSNVVVVRCQLYLQKA